MNILAGGENLIILMAAHRPATGAEKWGDNGTIFWNIFNTISDKMCGFYCTSLKYSLASASSV